MSHRLCIYHDPCYDGFTAAWVIKRFLPHWSNADFLGAKYGDAPPTVEDKDVIIVDFSYKRAVLEDMHSKARSLIVLDHHKTAEEDLRGLPYCTFDMTRSGAGLAWDELIASRYTGDRVNEIMRKRPLLVDWIEDRDLWRFSLEGSEAAMAYIATEPYTWEAWDALDRKAASLPALGYPIIRYIENYGEKACEQAHWVTLNGVELPVINIAYMNVSEHVSKLLERTMPASGMAGAYFRRGDGKWQFSLRSVPGVDCSSIAKHYGGGGHAQAAGFTCERLPWERDSLIRL